MFSCAASSPLLSPICSRKSNRALVKGVGSSQQTAPSQGSASATPKPTQRQQKDSLTHLREHTALQDCSFPGENLGEGLCLLCCSSKHSSVQGTERAQLAQCHRTEPKCACLGCPAATHGLAQSPATPSPLARVFPYLQSSRHHAAISTLSLRALSHQGPESPSLLAQSHTTSSCSW